MNETYATKLMNYLRENFTGENYRAILENILTNYMSEDDVRDFCEHEGYEEALQEEYSVTVEFSGSITYHVKASSRQEAIEIGEDMYEQENSYSLVDNINDYEVSAEID